MTPFLFFLTLGVVLITIELLVLGLSAFWFLFIGFGALITALYAFFVDGEPWLSSSAIFVFSSIVISAGLYKPLKKWQSTDSQLPGNDAIGQSVTILSWDEKNQTGKVMWSGVEWDAESENRDAGIQANDSVVIAASSGIHLKIKKD